MANLRVAAGVVAGLGVALLLACPVAAHPIAAPGTEAVRAIVERAGDVRASYQGTTASYSNDLYLANTPGRGVLFNNQTSAVGASVDLGYFEAGTELVFRMVVQTTGDVFVSGPAGGNPDGQAHARVQTGYSDGQTLISFEDLYNGPFNFNDLSFILTDTAAEPPGDVSDSFFESVSLVLVTPLQAAPEPASLAVLGAGLLGLTALRRRAR